MSNDFNEEDQINRAIAESIANSSSAANVSGGLSSSMANVNVNDTEEEIMRQILEQSKNDK